MEPKWEMMKKILTYTVEYSDFGGEENFIKEEDVLAETFSEGECILANYLEGREYRIISVCWKKMAIGEAAEHQMQRTADQPCAAFAKARDGKCYNCGFDEESHR